MIEGRSMRSRGERRRRRRTPLVDLCHDVDVDVAGDDLGAQAVFQLALLARILRVHHAGVETFERRLVRQEFEVSNDLASFLKCGRAKRFELPVDELLDQIQVRRDASCPTVMLPLRDRFVRFIVQARVLIAHMLNEDVVHDRHDR